MARFESRYKDRPSLLGYLLRLVFMMALVGGIGFVAFAYFGDLSRTPQERIVPVELSEE